MPRSLISGRPERLIRVKALHHRHKKLSRHLMPSSVQEDDVKQETSSVRCTVLLIADPLVRFALKQLLRTAGEVVVVGEVLAEQAVAAVRQLSPDIALIDARRVDEDLSEFLRGTRRRLRSARRKGASFRRWRKGRLIRRLPSNWAFQHLR